MIFMVAVVRVVVVVMVVLAVRKWSGRRGPCWVDKREWSIASSTQNVHDESRWSVGNRAWPAAISHRLGCGIYISVGDLVYHASCLE